VAHKKRPKFSALERHMYVVRLDTVALAVDRALSALRTCHNSESLNTSLRNTECHRHYLGNDFVFMQDGVPSQRRKVMQQFLRQNTPDFIAADEWASYSPDLKSFRLLLHWGYPAGFGVRRPTTSVCKSTGPQRGNQKQMEGSQH